MPQNSSALHVSPARQCEDARQSVAALRRKVLEARRAQSAGLAPAAHQEAVLKRHEEVLKERRHSLMLCEQRQQRDAAAKKEQREMELQRKSFLREAMYAEFEKRRREVTDLKGALQASREMARREREEIDELTRRQVREDRLNHHARRLSIVEQIEADRLAAHEKRRAEALQSQSYMEQRMADRSMTIAATVRSIRATSQNFQEARRRVEEKNQQIKKRIVDEAQRIRNQELETLRKEAASLQSELSHLSRY
jgi:hypothetical protein